MDMITFDIPRVVALIGAGCLAGMMNAIAGGGTLVTFPTLVLAGLPSIPANATSTVALLPASLSSAAAYRSRIRSVGRWLRFFGPVSFFGGLLGGILLVQTPTKVFDSLVPFLILFATLLFMTQAAVTKLLGTRMPRGEVRSGSWLAGGVIFQFFVAVYGGYFGAGIGILMLASLGMMGFEDVHEMNTLKVILGFLINIVAACYFIVRGLVSWPAAAIMMCGTIIGGYAGAHLAQRVSQHHVRTVITVIGFTISAVMFLRRFT